MVNKPWQNIAAVQKRHEMIVRLEREGLLHKQIALAVGLDRSTVSNHIYAHYSHARLHKNGVPRILCRCAEKP